MLIRNLIEKDFIIVKIGRLTKNMRLRVAELGYPFTSKMQTGLNLDILGSDLGGLWFGLFLIVSLLISVLSVQRIVDATKLGLFFR